MTMEREAMSGAGRKLTSQKGATLVFALVVFLILTMFCETMVRVTLNAAETSARLRDVEKVSASVVCAARLIQDSLTNSPEMIFRTENQRWDCLDNSSDNKIVNNVLVAALNNGSMEFAVSVKSDNSDVEAAFETVRLSVTAENRTEEALKQYLTGGGDAKHLPTLIIRFTHPAEGDSIDYAMTMRVMACKVNALNNPDGGALIGYAVQFADEGELNIRISPGVSS